MTAGNHSPPPALAHPNHLPLPPPGRRGFVGTLREIRGYSPPPAPSWKSFTSPCPLLEGGGLLVLY